VNVVPAVNGSVSTNFTLAGTCTTKAVFACNDPSQLTPDHDYTYAEFILSNPNPKPAVLDLYDTGSSAFDWRLLVYPTVTPPMTDAELMACSAVGDIFLAGSQGGYLAGFTIASGASVLVRVESQSGFTSDPTYATGSGSVRVQTTSY
jgi:hypothetical protein